MNPTKKTTELNPGVLSAFPEPVKAILHLIEIKPSGDVSLYLLQYVASFVHPDCVCNLAMLDALPDDAKQAALSLFQFCLHNGLSIDEQGAILRFIQPYLVRGLGAPIQH